MITVINGCKIDIALDNNEDLKIKGLSQYRDEHIKQNVISYLKSCKPEIIKKIKSGIEVEPVPQVYKMSVCIDSMPCKYIGINSDDTGTYPVCLYNNQPIHEPGFCCPLAIERFKKRLGIQDRQKRKYQPKKKVSSIPEVQQVEPEEIKSCELPSWAM
jgi:hypothetical protein